MGMTGFDKKKIFKYASRGFLLARKNQEGI